MKKGELDVYKSPEHDKDGLFKACLGREDLLRATR